MTRKNLPKYVYNDRGYRALCLLETKQKGCFQVEISLRKCMLQFLSITTKQGKFYASNHPVVGFMWNRFALWPKIYTRLFC